MDGVSAAASVITILETAWKIINYVKAVHDAGEAQRRLLLDLIRARSLLATLNDVAKEMENDEWARALQSLKVPNGPIHAFQNLLEEILDQMGIEKAPSQALRTHQSASVISKRRRSKFVAYFHRVSSSTSFSITPMKRSEDFKHPPNAHHGTIAIRLDTAMKDLKWPFTQLALQ